MNAFGNGLGAFNSAGGKCPAEQRVADSSAYDEHDRPPFESLSQQDHERPDTQHEQWAAASEVENRADEKQRVHNKQQLELARNLPQPHETEKRHRRTETTGVIWISEDSAVPLDLHASLDIFQIIQQLNPRERVDPDCDGRDRRQEWKYAQKHIGRPSSQHHRPSHTEENGGYVHVHHADQRILEPQRVQRCRYQRGD